MKRECGEHICLMPTKGFITIATGKKHYFELAHNLIVSYRRFKENNLPFAIITEKNNHYIDLFDDVIITDKASHSYLDKFLMDENLPYDETIFIEADVLIYDVITSFFDIFKDADDFSCVGNIGLKEDSKAGWFDYNKLPEKIKEKVSYTVGLHGGILYMKNTDKLHQFFLTCKDIVLKQEKYVPCFTQGGVTSLPDEPVIALSMAINKLKPIKPKAFFSYYPNNRQFFKYNIEKQICCPKNNKEDKRLLLHWGTSFTYIPKYEWELYRLNCVVKNKKSSIIKNIAYFIKQEKYLLDCKWSNFVEYASSIKWLRDLYHKFKN